jgi:hypothetical protein
MRHCDKYIQVDPSMEDPDCIENTLAKSAANVKSKLEKYFCLLSSCLTLATVLDPRSNLLYFEKYYKNNLLEYGKIKKQIQSTYASRYASLSKALATPNTTENNGSVLNDDSVLNEIFNPDSSESEEEEEFNELEKYFQLSRVKSDEDPLLWWKNHEHAYPSVAAMAKDYLCVVGSSTPCERIFSSAKYTVPDHRASLLNETIQAVQCLKSWFKHEQTLKLN